MEPVIDIRDLGKKYGIRKPERYLSLRDTLTDSVKNIFRRNTNTKQDFWALKDINLKVEKGDRLGIIGKNGAGKSTLLKILSRITMPTTGSAVIRGRLASLLEVGTGFHPELTGRENIFLNGSILGLKKREIEKEFDAIVEFSGVAGFLDTPLKYYSTGMQLRLAFAVAAHLEPEVLLIDEVLAVGDMEFQKKCLGKMEEVSKSNGRTILFVSHNMNYISSLCPKSILLDQGRIIHTGDTSEVVSQYTNQVFDRSAHYIWKEENRPGNDIVKLNSLRITDESGKTMSSFSVVEKICIEMVYEVLQDGYTLWAGHSITNHLGINAFDTHSVSSEYYRKPHRKGMYTAIVWIPPNLLNTGSYYITSAIFNHLDRVIHFYERDLLAFNVYDVFGVTTARGLSHDELPGVVRPLLDWEIVKN